MAKYLKTHTLLILWLLLILLPTEMDGLALPVSSLSSYLDSIGVRVSTNVEFRELPGYGISVVATSDIPADSLLMSVPSSVPLATTEPCQGFDAPKGVPSGEWKSYSWSQRLAFKLRDLPDSPYKVRGEEEGGGQGKATVKRRIYNIYPNPKHYAPLSPACPRRSLLLLRGSPSPPRQTRSTTASSCPAPSAPPLSPPSAKPCR